MKAVDSPSKASSPQRFRSLRSKIFIPFFILIITLTAVAIYGSVQLAERSFKNSVDQSLAATQEVLFRGFKKQETILHTYAVLMQQFRSISERYNNEAEISILQDRLFNTLEEANISTAFYPPDIRGLIQQESLVVLFDQARRSGKPRFRYSNEFGGIPELMIATPIFKKKEITEMLLLKTSMGDTFLREVTSSLDVDASLLTLTGQVMAKSSPTMTNFPLTPAQISVLGTGRTLYLNHDVGKGTERHLFSIIPLGSSDMVLLSIQASLKKTTEAQNNTIMQMLLVMVAVILVGTIIYFGKINNITRPVRDLRNATDAISRGNLNYRIMEISNDELGQIATTFNHMANKLETSYQERADQDIANALSAEAKKTELILERKQRERDKLNEELSAIQHESSALYQLNQAMTSSIDLSVLFDRILQVLNEILECDHIVLLVHNKGDSFLEIERTAGLDAEALKDVRFTLDQGVTGEAAQSQKTIYVKNIDDDDRNLSYHGRAATRGSLISSPLVVKGRLIGVINLHKKQIDGFSNSDQRLIQTVSNQTAIVIDNAQLLEKNRDSSSTDELTGLSNRRHFQDILKREVAQARRFSSNFSIVMCDIDGFKQLKNKLGNMHADALLRQVGQVLLKTTRGIDLVSRFGNDQFIILLPKTNKKGAKAAAEKLRATTSKEDFAKSIYSSQDFKVTISFGVTEFPSDSKNIYELLNLADRALFAAKKEGGDCSVVWEGPAPGPE
jgi:diguanylate cyclase (GGDEF)-like protein